MTDKKQRSHDESISGLGRRRGVVGDLGGYLVFGWYSQLFGI
jgi:hypothetical protein